MASSIQESLKSNPVCYECGTIKIIIEKRPAKHLKNATCDYCTRKINAYGFPHNPYVERCPLASYGGKSGCTGCLTYVEGKWACVGCIRRISNDNYCFHLVTPRSNPSTNIEQLRDQILTRVKTAKNIIDSLCIPPSTEPLYMVRIGTDIRVVDLALTNHQHRIAENTFILDTKKTREELIKFYTPLGVTNENIYSIRSALDIYEAIIKNNGILKRNTETDLATLYALRRWFNIQLEH